MEDDPLHQFVSAEEYRKMGATFEAIAESGKSLTRLPRKQVDRARVLEAIHEAFDLIGGVPRFAFWAHENPETFYKLWAKTAPNALQVSGEVGLRLIRPALPPSPLDQEFTDAEFEDNPDSVRATETVPSIPSETSEIRGDGSSPSRGEDRSVRE